MVFRLPSDFGRVQRLSYWKGQFLNISGGGILAFVEKDGVRDQFRLTPQEMLVGLMEHYGIPIPSDPK